jgi:glycosyltransferase 2 family protein
MKARRVVRAAFSVALVAACVLFVRRLDGQRLSAALLSASLPLVLLAAAINLLQMGVRSLFLRALIAPLKQVGLLRLCRYNLAMFAANNLLPARAGELVRVELLRAREGVPPSASLAVALIEKIVDAMALLVLASPLAWLLPEVPRSVSRMLVVLGAAAPSALVAAWVLARFGEHRGGLVGRLSRGAAVLRRAKGLGAAFGWALLSHLVDAAMIVLCLAALDLRLPLAASLLILLAVTLALTLPSAPAGLGTLEMGAVSALRLLGVDDTRALAFALVYHAIQVVPVTLLGAMEALRQPQESQEQKTSR